VEWVAGNPGATFVDTNSWTGNGDFSRDGLHLKARRPHAILSHAIV
jgi:hypothetical protein